MKFKKILGLLCLITTLSVFAATPKNPCNPCSPCKPCDFTPPCPPEVGAYNAPFIIDLSCSYDFFVSVSFLYWTATEEHLSPGYVFTGIYDQNNNTQQQLNPRKYEILSMDFEYDPGFKVALGYDFGCDGWGISAEYTRFHQTVKSSKDLSDRTGILQDGSSTSQIVPGWFFNNNSFFGNYRFAVTSIQTADASWKLSA